MQSLGRVVMRATRVRSFGTYKTSTGLVGLAVDKNGRETLLDLSGQILESVKVVG
jgi:hypothetical protein